MPIDPSTLPLCTIEDGSLPGQAFPCYWDAQHEGNGVGTSFVMPAPDTFLYADGTLICPADTMANDAVDGCVPLTTPEPTPEPVAAPVLTAPVGEPVAQVLASPTPVPELAHTGMDNGAGALMVVGLFVVGYVLTVVRSVGRRRS